MSCVILVNQSGVELPIGTLIVVDSNQARAYNSETDLIEDVIGAIYPTSLSSGRGFSVPDGPQFYLNDPILWNENLQYQLDGDGNQILNESYDPWNPYANRDGYCTVIYNGMVPVLVSYETIPGRWKLLRSGSEYNWYLVR